MSQVLVVGGAGYIGTHVCVELLAAGYKVTILDDLSNSKIDAIRRLQRLVGRKIDFVKASMGDRSALESGLETVDFDAVIHLAASKSVPASVADPLHYYRNNVNGTIALIEYLERRGVRRMVFSSSATVYRGDLPCPIAEPAPLGPSSPYGWSKLAIEQMLRDLVAAKRGWRAVSLRYFNPVGAHPSAEIGEDPSQPPGNLFPIVGQTLAGIRQRVDVFGDDYDTPDGTPVRDYVHVSDVARAHVGALELVAASGEDRDRPRFLRPRGAGRLAVRRGPRCPARDPRTPAGRRRRRLCRSKPGARTPRLGAAPRPRRDVPDPLGLAAARPHGRSRRSPRPAVREGRPADPGGAHRRRPVTGTRRPATASSGGRRAMPNPHRPCRTRPDPGFSDRRRARRRSRRGAVRPSTGRSRRRADHRRTVP